MAVYREGFHIVSAISSASRRIYPDAADYGVLVKQGDKFWNMAKQLKDWYSIKGSRNENRYATGVSVDVDTLLIDEWAVSDERKTEKEATEIHRLSYVTADGKGVTKGYDGIISIEKLTGSLYDKAYKLSLQSE